MQSSQKPILVLPLQIQPLIICLLLDLLSLLRLRKLLLLLRLRPRILPVLSFSLILNRLLEIIFNLLEIYILLLALILLLLLGLLLILHLLLDDQTAFGFVAVREDVFILLTGLGVGFFLGHALHEFIEILRNFCIGLGIALDIFIDLNGERVIDIINRFHPSPRVRALLLPLLLNSLSFFFPSHNHRAFLLFLLLLVLLLLL